MAQLELICDPYAAPPDTDMPVFCCDETGVVLQADAHRAVPTPIGVRRWDDLRFPAMILYPTLGASTYKGQALYGK